MTLLRQLMVLLLISQVIRLLFFIINYDYFSVHSVLDYLRVIFYSLRFDLSGTFSVNLFYIMLVLLPFPFMSRVGVQKVLRFIFIFTNSVAFIFDIADIAYFPYVRKRMTADVFDLMGRKSDFIDLLPNYISKFWYVSLLAILLVLMLVWIFRASFRNRAVQYFTIRNSLLYLLFLALSVVAIRGGIQLRPLAISNSVVTSESENIPLIINTPFSILQTFESQQIRDLKFFREEEVRQYFDPIKNYGNGTAGLATDFRNKNVVVIILESFGKGFTGIGGRETCSPFLDSLMQLGMTFNFAFANASRSADGIPAIISGIPYFMHEPFPFSVYATNKIDALPSLLKQKGYQSSFFHGGANGTMNFDSYSRSAGFDKYYGRNEYNNDNDYDGTWGIWDEPFLQFFAEKLNQQRQPFFSTVFTLSSHEPFAIPDKYKSAPFAKLDGIKKGIAYTDMALRRFFETVSREAWYRNTLFVITADHNYLAFHDPQQYYNQGPGLFAIPILFYDPGDTSFRGYNNRLMQQTDIMPSVLHHLHYDRPFFSFGQSVFDTLAPAYCFTAIDNQYFMLLPPWLISANFDKVTGHYHFRTDSMMQHNLLSRNDPVFITNEKKYLAYLQLLHSAILHNRQSIHTYK